MVYFHNSRPRKPFRFEPVCSKLDSVLNLRTKNETPMYHPCLTDSAVLDVTV